MINLSAVPIYELIENYIVDLISTEKLHIGEKIPTEIELSEKFNTSRSTVGKALGNLVSEGIIYRTPGRGSFVRMKSPKEGVKTLSSFSEKVSQAGCISSSKILEYCIVDARQYPNIQSSLKLSDNDQLHMITRRRYSDEEVIAVQLCFLSVPEIPTLEIKSIENSIFEYIEGKLGLSILQSIVKIQAIKPTSRIEKWFGFDIMNPLLKVVGVSYLANGKPFEVNESYYISEKYNYKTTNYR